ncbi:MAG: hypothetical protein Q8K30_00360, partial [Candidatus Gracilibacteria bacterium]|nr:hypothetical protein [Candidatus Gracilibacteria bacterium]
GRPLTQAEKTNITNEAIRGVKDGIIRATRDYLMQYIDLVGNLTTLTYSDISNTVSNVWNKITNPISTIATFNNGINKTLNKLEHLGAYEYSFGSSYIGTSVGFVVGVPGSKIINLGKLDNIVIKIDKTIDGLITNLLNNNIKKLGAGYVTKFNSLNTKIVSSFSKDKQEFVLGRLARMDDKTLKKNLDYPDNFINSFKDGRCPVVMFDDYIKADIINYSFTPINDGGFLKSINGNKLGGNYIFIIQNGKIKLIQTGLKNINGLAFNHSDLAGGKNVDYAGLINFNSGKISLGKGIDNNTGHFKTLLDNLDENIIKKALIDMNYDVQNFDDFITKKF